jgi:gliding motility-associated-like protein
LIRKLRLLLILMLTAVYSGYAQVPVASITVTPHSGCAPLAVSFNGNATGPAPYTLWSWNFGGTVPSVSQATSNAQNTATQFNVPGTYIVSLTVSNVNGTSAVDTVIITVEAPPVADFNVSKTTGCFPTTINFTNNSTPGPGGTITSFLWDFGDGFLDSTDTNPSHIYKTGGSFPVTLVVQNNFGCKGKGQVKNVSHAITLSNGISTSFTPALNSSCTLPVTATFTNQTLGPPTMSYSWNFGAGTGWQNGLPNNPTNNYTTAGTYNVQLAASSNQGCTDTATVPVTISASGNLSDFTGAGNVCINTPANFVNASSPPPISATWDFGDGSPVQNAINGQHTYTVAGPYNVTLTNTFAGCTGTVIKAINVVGATTTAFTATNINGCQPPLTTQFTDQTTGGATSWLWNFGDGTPTSNQQNPQHTYTKLGSFTVTLTTSSAPGCSNTLTKTAFVNVLAPVVSISNAPANGCAPYVFVPTTSILAVDGVATYSWNMGNGFLFNGPIPPAQTYPAGVYNISLTITTNGGCTATATGVVKVGSVQPVTNFSAVPTSACVGQSIQFTDLSSGPPDQWLWDFGDGSTATTQNPAYSYTKPGLYDVTLTAYDQGCFQKVTKTAFITINPPLADFTYTSGCGAINVYTFKDASTGATTWDWDFGDLTAHSTIQAPPPHTYAPGAPTIYNVTLKVTNGACSSSITKPVNVNQVTTINTPVNPVCNNTTITIFTSGPGNILGYIFDFGDGSPTQPSGSGATTHTYTKPGDYQIIVTTTDNTGCVTASAPYTMHISGPTVKFTTPNQISCGPLAAVFTDQSTPSPGATLKSWSWNFGDGGTANGVGPQSHNYNFQGIYQVMEKVTDNNGCSDSLIMPNYITVSIPVAGYTTTGVNFCPSSNIKFTNTSTGGFSPVYTWDFKDGSTYIGPNPPLHNFSAVGTYPVSLSVLDSYNCAASFSNPIPINIDTPNASFTMSASTSSCPPLNEQFTFAGHYASSYTWTFDNGGSAIIPNPSSIYVLAGDYYPSLTVTSPGGCIATFSDHIHIDGPIGALSFSPLLGCDTLTVNFNVVTSNSVSFNWNFNDGSTQITPGPITSHFYNHPGILNPFVTLVDASGCKVPIYGTSAVEIDSIAQTTFKADKTLLCDSGAVVFTSTSVVSPDTTKINNYAWDFGDGSPVSNGLNPVTSHYYSNPGVFTVSLTITTTGGCAGTFNTTVTVAASPKVAINGLLNQCEPAILTFSGVEVVPDPFGPLIWSWSFGNNQTATGQNPAPVSYPKAGEYVVKLVATNTKGCSMQTDTTTPNHLFIYPIPAVNAGADTTICLGTPLQLNASGAATSYNWLPPADPGATLSCLACTNPVADPVPNSTFFVLNGTSLHGCQAKDTIQVTVNTQPVVNVSGPDSVCLGQSTQLTASGASIYEWTPAEGLSNPNIANPLAKPDASQIGGGLSSVITYQVTGYDSKKCFSDTKTVNITAFNYPVLTLVPNATINVGGSYQINATATTNIVSLNWIPSNTLSCNNCLAPLATPTKTTKYDLTALNDGGCATTDSIRIQVICNGANFFVPNTFSPNGDGVNDYFIINGVGLNVIPSITIYNRWGQVVFQKSNFAPNTAANAWDGTFNGKPAPSDVYIYTIQILCDNATLIPYHGNITLIR